MVRPDLASETGPTPDAGARGWFAPAGESRSDALFVLAGGALGVGRDGPDATLWLDLERVANLDAIGDPRAERPAAALLQEVELLMDDGAVLRAGWTPDFCSEVVATLHRLAADAANRPSGAPDVRFDEITQAASPAAAASAPSAASAPAPAAAAPAATVPDAPAPAPTAGPAPTPAAPAGPAVAPAPPAGEHDAPRAGTLELEDVVYLGGYPGHTKKRKKCTATLGRAGIEVAGPSDLHFRISWDVVRTIEVQNSDEARFRMNAKIHRDASALVIECDQGVTILLEARDCPTIALRAAIGQLLADLPVVVV